MVRVVDSLVFVCEIYVLTVTWYVLYYGEAPDAFDSLASCLLFPPLSPKVALAGLRRVFSRAHILESCATDELGDPELETVSPGRGVTEVLFSSFLELYFAAVAPRRAYCDRLDLSYYLLPEVRSLGLAGATAFSRLP